MYDKAHPAFSQLQKLGLEITQKVKPKAIVVFSAHWQADKKNTIEVNEAEETELIYDFFGFPPHYYKEKFPNRGSKAIASQIVELLKDAGIEAKGVKRGLDHGVWASFKCGRLLTHYPSIHQSSTILSSNE
jgi:4,5-DOPA dioxygenase extradiol